MKLNNILLLAVVALVLTTASCNNDDDNTPVRTCADGPNLENIDEEQLDEDIIAIDAYLDANAIDAEIHPSGLRYEILEEGTGENITSICQTVTVKYTGQLMSNGEIFDKTLPGEVLTLSLANVILGWQLGVPLVKDGGKIKLYIPSQLGYGANGSPGSIPGDANLIFTIELIDSI